jgi:4a-hydroxytetrahydrobiopterin dehydratase
MHISPALPEEITEFLLREPLWKREGETLRAEFVLDDFAGAIAFINEVAELAEALNHHPDLDLRWNKVRLVLTTHRIHRLSALDLELAAQISAKFAAK